jgi:hypothetical protein
MGPFRIFAIKATTSSKGLTLNKNNKPTHTHIYVYDALYIIMYIYNPSSGKNKPHEGITNVHLFLGLLAWL